MSGIVDHFGNTVTEGSFITYATKAGALRLGQVVEVKGYKARVHIMNRGQGGLWRIATARQYTWWDLGYGNRWLVVNPMPTWCQSGATSE